MRGFTYGVAAIAAVGIMVVIAATPADQAAEAPADAQAHVETVAAPATSEVAAKTVEPAPASETLTLAVPKMHCEFACFPKVKETLEADQNVEVVELAPQPEDAWNAKVVVTYKPGFDIENAIAKLDENGYPESSVVE